MGNTIRKTVILPFTRNCRFFFVVHDKFLAIYYGYTTFAVPAMFVLKCQGVTRTIS